MSDKEKINYVELPASDLKATKGFFSKAFGWTFTDYGSEYSSFEDTGINGGFFKSNKKSTMETGGALIIFYSEDLEATQ